MFNDKLQPIYEGKVLVNQSALENQETLNPKESTIMGYGTFQIGTNYEQATNVHKRRLSINRPLQQV